MSGQTAKKVKKSTVTVIYNGEMRELAYNPKQSIQALLQHALNEFRITANRELMGLFDAAGNQLPGQGSVGDAGVEAGDELILRQTRVAGG